MDLLARARTEALTPRREPPGWLDDDRLRLGAAFAARHNAFVQRVLTTSSLSATFAARDVAPVLMRTGRLAREFVPRMVRTGAQTGALTRYASREEYVRRNYPQAVALGEMHREVGRSVRAALAWPASERVPMSQQATALVLSTFAWWPLEALFARRMADPERDRREIDGWLHLWSGLGYGMGIARDLLPTDLPMARDLAARLRRAQYAPPGEAPPEGVPVLLGGQVGMLRLLLGRAHAATTLAEFLRLSPGLVEALGLGDDPVARLERYADMPEVR